jgi:hypothetical protein
MSLSNPFRAKRPRSCYGCRALEGGQPSYRCGIRFEIRHYDVPYPRPAGPCAKPRTVRALAAFLQTLGETGIKPQNLIGPE